jgi:hypothetical protein
MGLLSFQHDIQRQVLGKAADNALEVPPAGGYRDVSNSMLTEDRPLPLSASTLGSFGAGTSWRSKHIGLKGIQASNIGSTINFNTNQVDPNVR